MIDLDYICFNSYNGYSVAARNNILALHRSGRYDMRITPLDSHLSRPVAHADDEIINMLHKSNKHTQIQIYHCIPPMQSRVKKKLQSIAYTTFESELPPKSWFDIMRKNKAVLVPSKFNQEFFQSNLDVPVHCVPHCINTELYSPDVTPMHENERFTFMFVGTWKERKGYRTLLNAWFNEFSKDDNVQLVLKTDKPIVAEQEVINKQKKYPNAAPVIITKKRFLESEMPSYIQCADCLVMPTYGEGFYLPGIQAMALGVNLIITNWSGCTDYATKDTSFLLEPDGFKNVAFLDSIPQFRNCKWAHITAKQLQNKMRYVYENPAEREEKALRGRELIVNQFSYSKLAEYFTTALENTASLSLTYEDIMLA